MKKPLHSIVPCAFLAASIMAGQVHSNGIYNEQEGVYSDDFNDISGIERIQGLKCDPGLTEIGIADEWTITQPRNPAGNAATSALPFSQAGHAVDSAVISAPSGIEEVSILQRWFSAEANSPWISDCPSRTAGVGNCPIYPVNATVAEKAAGARSARVLYCPDLERFTACQTAPGPARCSGLYSLADIAIDQKYLADLIVAGETCHLTWFVRTPNYAMADQKLFTAITSYTYLNGSIQTTVYKGGAVQPSGCAPGAGCNAPGFETTACPVSVFTDVTDPANLSPDFGGSFNYTPFSFGFCGGTGLSGGAPPTCRNCVDPLPLGDPNQPICRNQGKWHFILSTMGGAGNCVNVPCAEVRPATPNVALYIDGMMLTKGHGTYTSPAFDTYSPHTTWNRIEWNMDLNGGQTDVGLDCIFPAGAPMPVAVGAAVGGYDFPAGTRGQTVQYVADLLSPDATGHNPLKPGGFAPCVWYNPAYDGSLTPKLRSVSFIYTPDAGRLDTKLVSPSRLRSWKSLEFEAVPDTANGGTITVSIVDSAMNTIIADAKSGCSLAGIDPGKYPAIRISAVLGRNNNPAAKPRLRSIRISYEKMGDCLELDRNTLRLSRHEQVNARFCSNEDGVIELTIHDIAGQLVRRVFRSEVSSGMTSQVAWNGHDSRENDVAPGVYLITANTPSGAYTKKIIVAR